MSTRRNNFGPRPSGAAAWRSRVIADTARAVQGQPAAAAFGGAVPRTREATCGACGAANPARRRTCVRCGDAMKTV